MANTEEISVILSAKDKNLQRTIEKQQRVINGFRRNVKRDLSASARSVDTNMTKMQKSFVKFGAGILAAASARALISGIQRTVANLDDIGKTADRIGITTDALQELRAVAESSGVQESALDTSVEKLGKGLAEAAMGIGTAKEALDFMGLSAKELMSLGLDGALGKIADEINKVPDPMQKTALATQLFGRSGAPMLNLLREGASGMAQMRNEARALGVVIDEDLVRSAEDAQTKLDLMKRVINAELSSALVKLAPLLVSAARGITGLVGGIDDLLNKSNELASSLVTIEKLERVLSDGNAALDAVASGTPQGVADVLATADAALTAIDALANQANDVSREINAILMDVGAAASLSDAMDLNNVAVDLAEIARLWSAQQIGAEAFQDRLAEINDEAVDVIAALGDLDGVDLSNLTAGVDGISAAFAVVVSQVAQAVQAVASAKFKMSDEGFAARRASNEARSDVGPLGAPEVESDLAPGASIRPRSAPNSPDFGLPPVAVARGGSGGALPETPFADAVSDIEDETRALSVQAAELIAVTAAGDEYSDMLRVASTRARLLFEAQKAGIEITPALRAEIEALAGAYDAASLSADNAEDSVRRVDDAAKAGLDAVSDIFLSVLDGSKTALDGLGDLLLKMAEVQAQKAIMGFAGGGGDGVFAAIDGLLSGERALGGGVRRGEPYMVNENTPMSEIMVPSQGGGVLNVPQAQAALRASVGGGSGASVAGVSGPSQVNLTLKISGAVGEAGMREAARAGAVAVLQEYDRHVLPGRVAAVGSNPRKVS